MRIESNIREVIGQVERLKAAIPEAMQRALEPSKWEDAARTMALNIIMVWAKQEEHKFIPGFIDSIKVLAESGALVMRMRRPEPDLAHVITLAEAQAAKSVSKSEDLAMGLFDRPVRAFEDLILEWVEQAKDKDRRDWGKTDEEIASLIAWILLSPHDKGSKGDKASTALLPHILSFVQAKQGGQLDAEVVKLWLNLVLAGWRELVHTQYPVMVKQELRTIMGR